MRFLKFWQTKREPPAATPARTEGDEPALPTAAEPEPEVVRLDAEQLRQMSAVFSAPRWLRDLGVASWLLVGVAALFVGLTWVLGLTSTIVEPVLVGLVVATVASPAVSFFQRKRVPRALGAVIVLLALVALGAVIVVLIIGGISSQLGEISSEANNAADKLQEWLKDLGVNSSGATATSDNLKSTVPDIISTLLKGVAAGIHG